MEDAGSKVHQRRCREMAMKVRRAEREKISKKFNAKAKAKTKTKK